MCWLTDCGRAWFHDCGVIVIFLLCGLYMGCGGGHLFPPYCGTLVFMDLDGDCWVVWDGLWAGWTEKQSVLV